METGERRRIPPFVIQGFVSFGVTLNMANMGFVSGVANSLLPQLRHPDSNIHIDDSSASWIASLPGLTLILGNLFMPILMSKFGRRPANLCNLAVNIAGWVVMLFSNSVTMLIVTRIIQGIGIGMSAILGPALIGEYTSPKNRGLFLMSISVTISIAIFAIQAMGEYLPWKTSAIVCIGISLFNIVIVIFSPESPTFLAGKERYDDCRRVFRYLRGDKEVEELEKMIATQIMTKKEQVAKPQSVKENILCKWIYFKQTLRKKEFYKPLLIIAHLYIIAQWNGVNLLTSFSAEMFERILGSDSGINFSLMVLLTGVHRIVGNSIGLIFIKTFKRRVVVFSTMSLNIVALLALAVYAYGKENNVLPFDQPAVGILLVHILMFSIATGAIPVMFVLAGELYPMEYKALIGGISMIFYSMSLFSNVKTVLILLNSWGLSGTYCLYALIVVYCTVVIGVLLPETKDKTLQNIEEEFRGKSLAVK